MPDTGSQLYRLNAGIADAVTQGHVGLDRIGEVMCAQAPATGQSARDYGEDEAQRQNFEVSARPPHH
jgi:hypothetical protein